MLYGGKGYEVAQGQISCYTESTREYTGKQVKNKSM